MRRINPLDTLRILDGHYIRQVHRNGLPVASHQHTLQLLVLFGIDLLVRHVWRNVDEIPGPGFRNELEVLTPPQPRLALDNVDDTLEVTVVVGSRFGVGVDLDRAGPQMLRAHAGHVDGRSTVHSRCARSVGVQAVCRNDANTGLAPAIWGGVVL